MCIWTVSIVTVYKHDVSIALCFRNVVFILRTMEEAHISYILHVTPLSKDYSARLTFIRKIGLNHKSRPIPFLNLSRLHDDKWGTGGITPHCLHVDTRPR
jgi:hypothetical protein